ncbi:MAG: sigma-54-dependent transcriptional regulator [Gemmatimonadales bacterium]
MPAYAEGSLYFGTSVISARLLNDISAFAATPYPVLLLGPTGSGKTALAREIHRRSPRSGGPFIACPLPGIPDELRHAELAGVRRGAFTGALDDRVGAVEAAHNGTLFLDEIGYATVGSQQTLLTALESGAVRRIGEVRDRAVNVRVVCATSADLARMSEEGRFLAELYYRIECLTLRIPPLAERRQDILPLATRFLTEEFAALRRGYQPVLTDEAERSLRTAPWPGNIRQLKSACRYVATRLDSARAIEVEDLPVSVTELMASTGESSERARALAVLRRVDGNKAKAARLLGITRPQLYRLLQRGGSSASDPSGIQPA